MMKTTRVVSIASIASIAWMVLALLGLGAAGSAQAEDASLWPAYLDYAYVYSSAEPEALRARLADYGREAGVGLEEFVAEHFDPRKPKKDEADEAVERRKAIAHLLLYLANGEPRNLEKSVEALDSLEGRLARHENRYWHHYILAHRALEKGRAEDFVAEVLELWLKTVVPLETPYDSLQTLSLSESPNSGFVAALPYVYENISRLILLRSQQMGLDDGLGPLAAIVRLLHDQRVGAHPDVIPPEASSRDYLARIVERLNGPESDAGNLTFTLALFEASKYHDQARSLLATEGLGPKTIKALRVAAGAYETALNRADTEQGRCAVYTRVLRQLGEVYASKQRLGVDPEVELPFTLEGAIGVYETLARDGGGEGWSEIGYATTGRESYVESMHGLWEEIQEASLNAAEYYLSRSLAKPARADEHARNAARIFARYLSFFQEFATAEGAEGVPDSAYFAAHEAAKGVGDAYLAYAKRPRANEVKLATLHYRAAMRIFPFDRQLWPALTSALERQGRESEYMQVVRPAAEAVTRSRAVNTWIEKNEPGAGEIATLRRAFSDSLVLVYLGFAEGEGIAALEQRLEDLGHKHGQVEEELIALNARLSRRASGNAGAATSEDAPPAAPADAASSELAAMDRAALLGEIEEKESLLRRLDTQITASTRALPLYKETLRTGGLTDELRAQRSHPLHVLLRRMYHETRS